MIILNLAVLFAALLAAATVLNPRFTGWTRAFWALIAVLSVWRVMV